LSLLLTRKEKEEMVIKLAKEGKTTREIAKVVHMSLKDIGEIIRKFTGDHKDSKSNNIEEEKKSLSPCTQAFQIFREKKPLTDVAIILDLDADTVLDYYLDYTRLTGMYELTTLYNDLGRDLPLFLHLYDRIKKDGLNKEEISYMKEVQRNVADLERAVMWLNKYVPELERDKAELEQEIFRLRKIKDSLEDRM
jgi:transposase